MLFPKQWVLLFFGLFTSFATAQTLPEEHAPIGVMGEHVHKKDDTMFSYRFMWMDMKDNLKGTDEVSAATIRSVDGFSVVPTDMSMKMHMFGFMYAPSDRLTLMTMLPFIQMEMKMEMANGNIMTMNSEGIGDFKLNGIYLLSSANKQKWMLSFGFSLPTGSIDEFGLVGSSEQKFPYPMQIGSGTWDFMPGVTYVKSLSRAALGAQFKASVPIGQNDNGYSLGNRYQLTAWYSRAWTDWVSNSLRLFGERKENIDGVDTDLTLNQTQNHRPDLRAGTRFDLLIGANFVVLEDHRLAFEIGKPIFQDLEGPQLKTDLVATIGWQKAY